MARSEPEKKPAATIREAYEELRTAYTRLNESVVQTVMKRNYLQEEVTRLERLTADLEAKAALTEKNNPKLAAELREERKQREGELQRFTALLNTAIAEAEAAKTSLPEEKNRLLQQLGELRARLAQSAGGQAEIGAAGSPFSEADELWNRAGDKIRGLEQEASARGEVAAASSGQPTGGAYTPRPAPVSPDQSADAMLAALEQRLGISPAPPSSADTPDAADTAQAEGTETAPKENAPSSAGFLELDTAPTAPPPAPTNSAPAASTQENASGKTWNIISSVKGETSRMAPTQRVRVAAIGTGNIFRGAHLPAYPDIPQVQLVAFCDPDKQAQDMTYKRYQSLIETKIKQASERNDLETVERLERDLETVQICDDISEVIETVKPDLVDICTQPFLHAPLSIQALEAGLHVMCEKPMARSWLETQKVLETVARTGKFYQHNENWLWDRDYYTAKKLVESGAIGEPIVMFLATAHGGPEGAGKFWNSDFGGGGALLDNGIHAIGAAWYISGLEKTPTLVKAAQPFGMSVRMPTRIIDGRFQKVTVDDDAHILIRFEDANSGAWTTAHVEGSWSHRDSPDTAIIGTTGKIVFKSEEGRSYAVITDSYDREMRRIETSGPTWQHWPSSFYGEILNMVECVRNGVPSISGPEFGANCSAVVGAAYLSEKSGRKASSVQEFQAFAREIASRYPDDPKGADNALVDALLSAVRK